MKVMSLPELVRTHLGDEDLAARVALGGEDELYTTPTRTLVYRAEGLLSDEAVEEYRHDVERITVSEGRRKAKLSLDYGLDGSADLSLPAKRLDQALHPVIAGVLNAVGITDPGESVERTFRFSELTLVVTSARVVKHIGAAVWNEEYEEYHYDDVTDLAFEDGSVATSVVFTLGDRQERFKAPNESARAARESLTAALLAHHDVESVEEFRVTRAAETDAAPAADEATANPFGDGPDPLRADPTDLAEEPANATRVPSAEPVGGSAGDEPADPADSADARADVAAAAVEGATGSHAAADAADAAAPSAEGSDATSPSEAPSTDSNGSRSGAGEATNGSGAASVSPESAGRAEAPTEASAADPAESAAEAAAAGTDPDERPEQSERSERSDRPDRPEAAGQSEAPDAFEGSPFESSGVVDDDAVAEELLALREAVERQTEQLARQEALVEQLIQELRRGR